MISNSKKQKIDKIIFSLTKEEIIWTSGYLSGFVQEKLVNKIFGEILIIYISETGNSKLLAEKITKNLKSRNIKVKLKSVENFRYLDIKKANNLILISSTHGEGEVPENGQDFFKFLQEESDLKNLNFLTIALGDSSYPLFCQAGKDFNNLLKKSGAKELNTTIELDVNFAEHITEINNQINEIFSNDSSHKSLPTSIKAFKKKDYVGEIATNINLNDIGSTKETRHIEITTAEEINFQPGDSAAILLSNEELGVEGTITPRLYSISSSPRDSANEIHLTVGVVRYGDKEGLFSSYLSRLAVGQKIKFSISPNNNFRLPKDESANIIMIGAGTGIAPFRSFIAQRNELGSSGKNWLFFGDRNFQSDFLYQSEWQEYLSLGVLNKIDVAFSRDQEEKIYVSHKIKQQASELFSWLENGAYFYVCGDKNNMAKDVEKSLLEVIKDQSNQDPNQYLENLIKEGRYLRDIY